MKIYKERKNNFRNTFCDEVLWIQYNILQTHKLKYNDLNHANVIFTYAIFWLILKYNMVFKNWWKKHCASSVTEKKPFREESLGSLAREPQHDF